jgi:hypothetical protein
MAFAPALRKFTVTTHVTTSVGWIGAVLVFLAIAAIGLSSQDERIVRGAYLVMAPAAWLVLVPLAHASLLSGIVLSLGTTWGLLRHYWVVLKLVITAFSTVILMIYMGTIRQMAGVAADPVIELGLVRNPSPLLHAIFALVLLLVATVLAIYKPFGMTPYGIRAMRARMDAQALVSTTVEEVSEPTPRRWEYLLWITGLTILGLIIVSHLLGSGTHGH